MPRSTPARHSIKQFPDSRARSQDSNPYPLAGFLWLPFLILAVGTALLLAAGVRADVAPDPGLLQELTRPSNPALLWVLLCSSALSIVGYAWSRRGSTRPTGLVVTAFLAVVSLVLGMASYWPCSSAEASPFSQLYWSLALFVGSVAGGQDGSTPCFTTLPLALQAARLTALTATFAGIAGIVAAVSRRRLESLVARYSRRVVVVLGLDAATVAILRVLAEHLDRRTRLVVVESTGDPRVAVEARSVRASLVTMDVSVGRSLDELLLRRGRIRAKEVYVLGSNLPETIRTVRRVEAAMAGRETAPTDVTKVIARIDDPWVAQTWRRAHVTARTPWLADAISFYEVTARYIVEQAVIAGAEQIILIGNSPLSLAVLSECAQQRRERGMLSSATTELHGEDPAIEPVVVLMGAGASQLKDDHRRVQRGFGNDSESPPITVHEQPGTVESVAEVVSRRPGSMVALTASPEQSMSLATRLAANCPELLILAWSTAEPGIPSEPLMGRLYPFGLNMVGKDNRPPMDTWTRLARLLHQEYVLSAPAVEGDVPPSRRPWDQGLPAFYQSSNVRQLSCLLSEVTRLGRSWSISAQGHGEAEDEWTEAEIRALAEAEHRSWRTFYLAHGWRYSPERDDERLRHNLLREWDDLDPAVRQVNEKSVRRGLLLLKSLGYRATRYAWHQYRRTGEVHATRLTTPWSWKTEQGSVLVAKVGDWRLSADGRSWSADHQRFGASYRLVSGDRYERVGVVRARLAHPGERVNTMEGDATAAENDWVVEGEAGDRWVVPSSHFLKVYARADQSL